jgi:hypothetical protein
MSNAFEQSSQSIANCPRCGYDQRGVIASWSDSCPISNSCTECGLDIQWSEILNPIFAEPNKWFIEAKSPLRGLARRMLGTFLMALRPWRFWREVRMVNEPRWSRAFLFLFLLSFIAMLIVATSRGYNAWQVWHMYSTGASMPVNITFAPPNWSPSDQVACTTNVKAWDAIWPAIVLPFSSKSPGVLTPTPAGLALLNWQYPGNTGIVLVSPAYPSPRSLLRIYELRNIVSLVALSLMITILCPVGFLALPVSRFKAKVLWKHIYRIALYSFVMTWISAILMWCYAEPPPFNMPSGLFWMESAFGGPMVHIYLPLMLIVWWGFAISRYLRMKHAWAVASCIVIIALCIVWLCELTWYNANIIIQ